MNFKQTVLATSVAIAVSGTVLPVLAQSIVSTVYSQTRSEQIVSSGTPKVTVSENSDTVTKKMPDGSSVVEKYRLVYTITTTPVVKKVTTYQVATSRLSNGKTQITQTPIKTETVSLNDTKQSVQRILLSSTVAGGPAKTITAFASQPTLDFDPKNYNYKTYYNNAPNLGTPTAVPSNDPNYYLTTEAGKNISLTNANYAYARGWTGKGSTILIMDSGIDAKNKDFAGKIKYSIDYTATGIQDTNGHGTHVAGIAAGARNGTLAQGIAYDADLAIAKITTGGGVAFTSAQKALVWAGQYNDIVVASLSANTSYSSDYQAAMNKVAAGMYVNTHAIYGGKNYYNGENPMAWAGALPKEMVLTVAAGNSSNGYVQNPATFATATDANGNLLLGGRILVVGNWNDGLKTVEGATAGHVCKDYSNNTCKDKYLIKDFYILAPGSGIVSTGIGDTTKSMSGTSQATPAVAGAIAIVHQMWPYMKGDQMVQLLLKTANKNLPNYDANVMGAGLLDLDRATRPLGNLAISTSGRTGTATPITGSINLPGYNQQVAATLSSVSAVDDMKRDFTVNLSNMMQKSAIINNPMVMDYSPGQSWSAKYAGVAAYNFNGFSLGQVYDNTTVSLDSRMLGYKTPWIHQLTMTRTNMNPYVQFSGSWGSVQNATTLEYNTTWRDTDSKFWAQAGTMQTSTSYTPGLVTRVTPIYTVHGTIGYNHQGFDFYTGIKPYVVAGSVEMTLPTSVTADGDMIYSKVNAKLAGGNPVGFAGAKWTSDLKKNHLVMFKINAAQDGTYYAVTNYQLRF